MPTRTRKRKASEDGAEAEEVPQPAKKTARTTQGKSRVSKTQSSKDGDSSKRGGAGSNFTTGNNTSKNSKSTQSSARGAKNEIRRHADSLIHMIEDQYNNSRSGIARTGLLSSKIAAILQDGIDTRSIVYQKSHDRIKTFQDTIRDYETTSRDSINFRKPPQGAQWEQDAKDISKVDKKAMEILIQALNGLVISGEHGKLLHSSPRSTDDIEQAAWRWIGGIPPAEDGWGSSARETLKAFAGVVKLLL